MEDIYNPGKPSTFQSLAAFVGNPFAATNMNIRSSNEFLAHLTQPTHVPFRESHRNF